METFPEGFQIRPVDEKKAELLRMFGGHRGSATVEVAPRGWLLSAAYRDYCQELKDFKFRASDVVVQSHPKAGTTWLQEIVWTMVNNPNQDHPMKDYPLVIRSPYLETDVTVNHITYPPAFTAAFKAQFPDFDMSHGVSLHLCETAANPRTIKTHFSFDLLSQTAVTEAKVVYIIRDPRDTCISFYYYTKLFLHEGFEGTLDDFINVFIAGAYRHGTYWPSVAEAWKRRDHPNVHIMFYEKLKKNTTEELKSLDKFLGTNLTPEQLKRIEHFTSFAEMKKRDDHVVPQNDYADVIDAAMVKKDGGFFRKGESGGWKNVLTQEQKEKFEVWIKEHCPDPEIMEIITSP